MSNCIAQRELLFSTKGSGERHPLVIRVFAPRKLKAGDVDFEFTEGAAVCTVEFDGFPEMPMEKTYGADSLQALQLAVNVEPTLIRIGKKYDLYFPTGEGYFEN